jgi:hypothetical protein
VGILPSLCCDVCSDAFQLATLYTADCVEGYEVGTKHFNFTDNQNFREENLLLCSRGVKFPGSDCRDDSNLYWRLIFVGHKYVIF